MTSSWLGPCHLHCLLAQPCGGGHKLGQRPEPIFELGLTGASPDRQGGGHGLRRICGGFNGQKGGQEVA